MKRFFSLLFVVVILICVFSSIAIAENVNVCGENIIWYFDETTGVLHIDGSGEMCDYSYIEDNQPWCDLREDIVALSIGDGVTYIGEYAFERLKIEKLIIPAGVQVIGAEAFNSCKYLTEVVMECDELRLIDKGAFSGCDNLKAVSLPKSATVIGDYAFFNTAIEHLVLPDGIVSVGVRAFDWCNQLKDVTVMGDLSSIGDYAFSGNEALSSVEVNGSIAEIGIGAFSGCLNLSLFEFKGTEKIGNNAFSGCMNLCDLELSESLISIGEYSFENTNISSLYIPENVESIGRCSFSKCISLDRAVISGEETILDYGVFSAGDNELIIYCHNLSKAQKYCEVYGIEHKLLGDANGDLLIDSADAVMMRKAILGDIKELDIFVVDINCDKVCDILDLIKLKKMLA